MSRGVGVVIRNGVGYREWNHPSPAQKQLHCKEATQKTTLEQCKKQWKGRECVSVHNGVEEEEEEVKRKEGRRIFQLWG